MFSGVVMQERATAIITLLLPSALGVSLVIGVLGSTYVAAVDREFRASYGRIVDSLVTGTLGAVVGGGSVAAYNNLSNRRKKEDERDTSGN